MFDDPKLRLKEMEQALKEAEWVEPQEEAAEEPDWLQEAKDLLNSSATEPLPIRNKANNYGRQPESQRASRTAHAKETLQEPDAVFVEKPKRKGAGGLVLLALLELVAMGLIVLWWIRWMA